MWGLMENGFEAGITPGERKCTRARVDLNISGLDFRSDRSQCANRFVLNTNRMMCESWTQRLLNRRGFCLCLSGLVDL